MGSGLNNYKPSRGYIDFL